MKWVCAAFVFFSTSAIGGPVEINRKPSQSMGAECGKAAISIAQMNLDQKARAAKFTGSLIIEKSLKKMSQNESGSADTLNYQLSGQIYQGSYLISVIMGSDCGVKSVSITDSSE